MNLLLAQPAIEAPRKATDCLACSRTCHGQAIWYRTQDKTFVSCAGVTTSSVRIRDATQVYAVFESA